MRVMLVASYPESILTFRGALIEALQAAGCEVVVLVPEPGAAPELHSVLNNRQVVLEAIPLKRTSTNPWEDVRLLFALVKAIRRHRPTVLMPYTIKPVIYSTLAGWLASVPRRYALITGLGYVFTSNRGGWLRRLIVALYRAALSRTHKVFFQNPDDERLFREMGVLPDHVPSVVVNGSGVDINQYCFHEIDTARPVFLLIGRLLGDKGVREYAEAARRLRHHVSDARFLLAGWIDTNPDAIGQEELDAWISEGTIEFLGRLGDVRPAIAAASVYVLPSYREGTPRTVLEAMAMGRPVITTDAPGCRETVIDGDNGFLVPVKSVDALVEAMMKFIHDPTLALRMGKRSREIAEEKYDVHKVNAVMLREMGITPAQEGTVHGA
ncbi:glycosyltransferase family 4 protein [Thermomonas fusca]|uniref:Glycosyltransferase family 1 protein n=1 Tax=Thermomonas fusca TaxID=215690 RepID=A0A5R9PCW6_9GAMM|nr:glycosyltransferase family 4 protein [Thermomonas fusca]TLX21361.1 glycosyltransferase family 1 protein [Thermomonas fusca]